MTATIHPTPSTTPAPGPAPAVLTQAAAAVAAVLPAAEPLTPGGAQPGTPEVVGGFAGAAEARVENPRTGTAGTVAVLVGPDLVEALASSPLGGLDLAAACQPALDAAAEVLGGAAAAAQQVDLSLVVADLAGPFTVVPLVGRGTSAAVLVSDALLPAPGAAASAAPPAAPAAAPSVAGPPAAVGPALAVSAQSPAQAVHHAAASGSVPRRGIEMLHGVDMEVTVELGRTRMTVRDLLALSPGAVLELDRAAGSPADLLVNGRLIARGEVVVIDEDFGLRVTEILDDRVNG